MRCVAPAGHLREGVSGGVLSGDESIKSRSTVFGPDSANGLGARFGAPELGVAHRATRVRLRDGSSLDVRESSSAIRAAIAM